MYVSQQRLCSDSCKMRGKLFMRATTDILMTAETFWSMPHGEMRRELVRGEVVETMPPNYRHGKIAARLCAQLIAWTEHGVGGDVGVESGFTLARNPDTVRGPDVFYLTPERAAMADVETGFSEVAPDLAVEIVSLGETAADVQDRVWDYLNAGTRVVWVMYPRRREVVVHTPDGLTRRYTASDTLEHPDLLPGFACVVGTLFE